MAEHESTENNPTIMEEELTTSEEEKRTTRTSELYRTKNLPERFDRPELIQGYNTKSEHPMYRTTGSLYGSQAPSVHTVPTEFHGKSQKFSKALGRFGMYRNHSLNTAKDRSTV